MEIKSGLAPAELPVVTQQEMGQLLDQLMTHVVTTQKEKGGEYSGAKNALAYFETVAKDAEVMPEKVLWIFLKKHLESIRSYINNLDMRVDGHDKLYDDLPVLSEPIEGRIVDAITYLCLFAGQTHRRRLQQQFLTAQAPVALSEQMVGAGTAAIDLQMVSAHAQEEQWVPPAGLNRGTVGTAVREIDLSATDEPMGDREAFTPAPVGQWTVKQVSYADITQQTTRLALAFAGYGMFIRLLFDQGGNVVDPTQPGVDIASSQRYRVVAQANGHLLVISEQGQVKSLNPETTACFFYTDAMMYPVLPTFGQELKCGRRFAGVANSTDWSGIAEVTLHIEDEAPRMTHVDMDVIAAEISGL